MNTTKLLNDAFEKYNAGLVTITELSNAVLLVESLTKADYQTFEG